MTQLFNTLPSNPRSPQNTSKSGVMLIDGLTEEPFVYRGPEEHTSNVMPRGALNDSFSDVDLPFHSDDKSKKSAMNEGSIMFSQESKTHMAGSYAITSESHAPSIKKSTPSRISIASLLNETPMTPVFIPGDYFPTAEAPRIFTPEIFCDPGMVRNVKTPAPPAEIGTNAFADNPECGGLVEYVDHCIPAGALSYNEQGSSGANAPHPVETPLQRLAGHNIITSDKHSAKGPDTVPFAAQATIGIPSALPLLPMSSPEYTVRRQGSISSTYDTLRQEISASYSASIQKQPFEIGRAHV